MKKVEVITRNQKDEEKRFSFLYLTPSERLINMFRLMELSYYLRSDKEAISDNSGKSQIIEVKLVNGNK